MFYYYIFKNNREIGWTILHENCHKLTVSDKNSDTLMIRGSQVFQPRAPCRKCGKLLDEKAANKFLEKRKLEKPLRDLTGVKIVKSHKKFSLLCGSEPLLQNVEFLEIKNYVLTNFKPSSKIRKEFEELLFQKLMKAK